MPEIPSLQPTTLAALAAVSAALALARSALGTSAISSKGGRDLVTAADVAAEDSIRERLEVMRYPVVGEERGGASATDGTPYWLVDPICGTRNFASGVPLYAVNVSLVRGDEVVAGVVGDGSTGDIFAAERGRGSWRLRDGEWGLLEPSEAPVTIVVEDSKCVGERRVFAARFFAGAVRADRWYFRSYGSSLPLAFVAAGRVSAYVDFQATALHSGAGVLVATEAGAVVTDVFGEPWTLDSTSILCAATPALHAELLGIADEARGGSNNDTA